jgi:DNA-binding MarR family transcriptional regulator
MRRSKSHHSITPPGQMACDALTAVARCFVLSLDSEQVVTKKAVRLHCHSGPRSGSDTVCGRPTATAAPAATIATAAITSVLDRCQMNLMAFSDLQPSRIYLLDLYGGPRINARSLPSLGRTTGKAEVIGTMQVHELTRILEYVSERVGGEVQVTTVLVFLFVAQRGRCTQKSVEDELKLTNATASRNVSFWTHRRADRQPGMGFIERIVHDYDQRLRELVLTPTGKKFYQNLFDQRILASGGMP